MWQGEGETLEKHKKKMHAKENQPQRAHKQTHSQPYKSAYKKNQTIDIHKIRNIYMIRFYTPHSSHTAHTHLLANSLDFAPALKTNKKSLF